MLTYSPGQDLSLQASFLAAHWRIPTPQNEMKLRGRNIDLYGLTTVMLIVSVLGAANLAGIFHASDACLNDLVVTARPTSSSSDVVLVYAPESAFSDPSCELLGRLSSQLKELGAKKIGLAFEPTQQQFDALNALPINILLTTGTIVGDTSTTVFDPAPDAMTGTLGLKLDQSVYRDHPTVVANDQTSNSFELALAGPFLKSQADVPTKIGVRFVGGPNGLPHVKAIDILRGEIISELIANKVVLVGPRIVNEVGFVTPTTFDSQRMSQLELRGNIVNTLIRQSWIQDASQLFSLCVLSLFAVVACQIFRQVSPTWIGPAFALILFCIGTFSWITLHYFDTRSPATLLLLANAMALGRCLVIRFRIMKGLLETWNLMLGFHPRMHNRDSWELFSDSVYQNFNPTRMVLFELEPGATHLKVIKTTHCSPNDIFERRRDINRVPYCDAVELGAAKTVGARQFFARNRPDCEEFIVPLILMSEVLGMVVLEMPRSSVNNWNNFENFLTLFANDMAVLINKQRMLDQQQEDMKRITERLRDVPETNETVNIRRAEIEYRNVANLLDDALDATQTATAICDVFGLPIKINARMITILQDKGIVIDDVDCVQLLTALTARDWDECRTLFRQCTIEGRRRQIVVESECGGLPNFVFLAPVRQLDQQTEPSTRCISIQLVEGRIFDDSMSWEHQFEKQNFRRLRNQLDNLKSAIDEIRLSTEPDPSQQYQAVLNSILDQIGECGRTLGKRFGEDAASCVLFDSRQVWQSALREFGKLSESRLTKVEQKLSNEDLTVFANPLLLEQVFDAILTCFTDQAGESARIRVSADRADQWVVFEFTDISMGAPIRDLRNSLNAKTNVPIDCESIQGDAASLLTPEQFDRFNEIESWLQIWNANLAIRCTESLRIGVELTLCREREEAGHTTRPTVLDQSQDVP